MTVFFCLWLKSKTFYHQKALVFSFLNVINNFYSQDGNVEILIETLNFQLCPECQGSKEQHGPLPEKLYTPTGETAVLTVHFSAMWAIFIH